MVYLFRWVARPENGRPMQGKTPGFMICCALNRHILFMCVINRRFPNMVAALEDDVINFVDGVIGKIRVNAVALLFENLSVFL